MAVARLGLLGGTFDPVHAGHVAVASAARERLGLSRVWLLPTRIPPHRPTQPSASIYHRFALTGLAALSAEGLEACDIDAEDNGPSYSYNVLARLHEQGHAASTLVFILGADAFADIASWYRYPAVLDMCHFAVISRPGLPAEAMRTRLPEWADRFVSVPATAAVPQTDAIHWRRPAVYLIEASTPEVSSTVIRQRLHAGESIRGLVPLDVERYITRHHLYAGDRRTAGHLHEHTSQ